METEWLKGKVVIVGGGASGIGAAIASEAAASGATVAIFDIDDEMGQKTAGDICGRGGHAHYIQCDLTESTQILAAVKQVSSMGAIAYLANSAGLQTYGTAETTTEEDWDRTLRINLTSIFLSCKYVLPEIRKSGGGGIVNISSIQGIRCQTNVVAYATSKGAVIALTRAMGLDHAKEGISVNCICPGSVDTPLLRYGAAQHGKVDEVLKEWGDHHPIGRIGSPEEIARVAMFLWSPASNFMVGQAVVADGGLGSIIL